eukprot:6213725-Pleurochrysis_carterae.AAC.1
MPEVAPPEIGAPTIGMWQGQGARANPKVLMTMTSQFIQHRLRSPAECLRLSFAFRTANIAALASVALSRLASWPESHRTEAPIRKICGGMPRPVELKK